MKRMIMGTLGLALSGGLLFTPMSGVITPESSAYVKADTAYGWVTIDGETYFYYNGEKKKRSKIKYVRK